MIRVKICGITSLDDALMSLEAGADALGFNFCFSSKRFIEPEDVREIIDQLPPFVNNVGIFSNEVIGTVKYTARLARIDTLQFHGAETSEYCDQFSEFSVVKTLNLGRSSDPSSSAKLLVHRMREYNTTSILLDSGTKKNPGGTGERFDWEVLRIWATENIDPGKKIIVAGGLCVENIGELLSVFTPYAVDVASGVESEPGVKDPELVKEFIRIVKSF